MKHRTLMGITSNTARGLVVMLIGFVGLAGTGWAESKEIVSSLTLEETVDAALRENPQLRSMRAKWEAMTERPVQERTLPNPMLQYSAMDMIRSKRRSLSLGESFLESSTPLMDRPGGRITAAATTGPHSAPRPASSIPARSGGVGIAPQTAIETVI